MRTGCIFSFLIGAVYALYLENAVQECLKDKTFLKTKWVCDPNEYLSVNGRERVSFNLNMLQSAACPCEKQSHCYKKKLVLKNTGSEETEAAIIPAHYSIPYTGVLVVVDLWNDTTLEKDSSVVYQNELKLAGQTKCDTGILLVFNVHTNQFYAYRGNETTRELSQTQLSAIMSRATNFEYGANTTQILDTRALILTGGISEEVLYNSVDEHTLSSWIGWTISVAVALLAIILIITVICTACFTNDKKKILHKSLKYSSPPNTIYAVPPSVQSPAFGSSHTEPIYVISEPSTSDDLNIYQSSHPYADPPFVDPRRQFEYQSKRMPVF